MDTWSPKQLKMMQVGGNGNFKSFLEEHGVPQNASLIDKYNSEVCRVYKDKVSRLAEGKPWQPPKQPPTYRGSSSGLGLLSNSSAVGSGSPQTNSRARKDDDEWERWLDEGDKRRGGSAGSTKREKDRRDRDRSRDKRRNPWSTTSSTALSHDATSQPSPSSTDVSGRESALRMHSYSGDNEQLQRFKTSQSISSDDFYGNPSAQGGMQQKQEDWQTDQYLSYIGASLQKLTVVASAGVEKLAESTSTVSKTIQERNWSEDASAWKQTVVETSSQGWSLVSSYWQQARESFVEPTVSSLLGYPDKGDDCQKSADGQPRHSAADEEARWRDQSRHDGAEAITDGRAPAQLPEQQQARPQSGRIEKKSREERNNDKTKKIGNGWDEIAWSSDSDEES